MRITTKPITSDAQKQSSGYTHNLIKTSLAPLVAINTEGKIINVNQAKINITGRTRKELIGSNFIDYFTEPQKASEVYLQVFEKGSVSDSPLTFCDKNGKLTDVLFNGSVYKDEQGNILGVIIVARDVAVRKCENELIIANKELVFQNNEKEKITHELAISKKKEHKLRTIEKKKCETALFRANIKKETIEKSKSLTEEKNKDITDSINYAKRIQQAILPLKKDIYASLPLSFILFKPKDIVSGDFYWFKNLSVVNSIQSSIHNPSKITSKAIGGGIILIAAADCTGHGVPGALMSMLGSEKLDEAVYFSSDTSKILNHLNNTIKNSLHQSERENPTRDGMDIALCSIEFPSLLNTNKTINLKYAGANRPIWIIRKGQSIIEEIKGTKRAIGGFTADNHHFDSHELKLQKGDTFYLSTDGFADQFGGPKKKKLMSKKFKEILLSIQDKPMKDQKEYLNNFIENWGSEVEQVDDILIIGVRV